MRKNIVKGPRAHLYANKSDFTICGKKVDGNTIPASAPTCEVCNDRVRKGIQLANLLSARISWQQG